MKTAHHIRSIEIRNLWPKSGHIVWQLQAGVNVLSGRNGAGKSTIIAAVARHLKRLARGSVAPHENHQGVNLHFEPSDADFLPFDWVRSYDRPFVATEGIRPLEMGSLHSELDWQLYQLQRRYLDYQVKIANRIIEQLAIPNSQAQQEAANIAQRKTRFQDIIDELFAPTQKRIDRTSNELRFLMGDLQLETYALSSGEKQLIIILLTALIQDGTPHLLLMDEPEASLHFDWQQQLIALVLELNPAAQIIISTHSPALILDGWENKVTEVSEIFLD